MLSVSLSNRVERGAVVHADASALDKDMALSTKRSEPYCPIL